MFGLCLSVLGEYSLRHNKSQQLQNLEWAVDVFIILALLELEECFMFYLTTITVSF